MAFSLLCLIHMLAASGFAAVGMIVSLIYPHPVPAFISPFAIYCGAGMLLSTAGPEIQRLSPLDYLYLLADTVSPALSAADNAHWELNRGDHYVVCRELWPGLAEVSPVGPVGGPERQDRTHRTEEPQGQPFAPFRGSGHPRATRPMMQIQRTSFWLNVVSLL